MGKPSCTTYIKDRLLRLRRHQPGPDLVDFPVLQEKVFGDPGRVRRRTPLPDDKVIIPGALESKTNVIEHPELVAQRIGRYADLVGKERVIAGSDCGYGTWVGQAAVDPDVVWAKLAAMSEGARIASERYWD